ncbi:YccT family protein [Ectothiorhodospira mobilis]|uniref:YccT family protein n=1 Tax=Ectothiorhodospira mobilis TaxID=195064 RepID=UPI001904FFD6|nr:DUF2057 domain-containing protein [Ectothiorhodospira mobilis]
MKVTFLPLCIMPFLVPSTAIADVTLMLGECLRAHVVNGQAMSLSVGDTITLADGEHQLVVNCTRDIGRTREDSFPETSDAFVLRFVASEAELHLQAPAIRTKRELQIFNRDAEFQLTDENGQPVPFDAAVLEKEGFHLFRDYQRELEEFNRTSSSNAVHVSLPGTTTAAGEEAESVPDFSGVESVNQETVRQMLRYWYRQANKNTRKEWKNWIRSSDESP